MSELAEQIAEMSRALMLQVSTWTEEALAQAADGLPEGADLGARLLVRDHQSAAGLLKRREVLLDGEVVATATITWQVDRAVLDCW